MRFTPSLILALTILFALHLPAAIADDASPPPPPIKQALAEPALLAPALNETDAPEHPTQQKIADTPGTADTPDTPGTASTADTPLLLQPSPAISEAAAKKPLNAVSLEEPADLWARIREGFALQELDSPLVESHVNWYVNRPDYVKRMVERSQLYLYHIVEEVEKRGMPTEIALLPMIESAFNPKAYSRSHAAGIWQFMPTTGKNFGLKQNWWYDGRRDVTAATDAALDYLQKLHDMFGSWELALAAYNWGEGSVQRAIARNQKLGLPTDYLSLKMPAETRNYLPKLMAVKRIIIDPAANGLNLASIPNRPYFIGVAIPQHIDVAVAARLAEMPLSEFISLNPAYNRPVINAKGTRTLLLPVDKADTFTNNLENYDKPLVSWKSYTPARGEKLASVAHRFSISVARLKEVNSLTKRGKLSSGQMLLVPLKHNESAAPAIDDDQRAIKDDEPARSTTTRLVHAVRKGDTLASIARHYRISSAQIKNLNHLKSNRLSNGQKLVIRQETAAHKHVAVAAKAKNTKLASESGKRRRHYYTIRRGDTVASIAKRFKVAINDIQRWNNLSARRGLTPGHRVSLMLPANS
ncbi:MAG TPA: LysM peptidoglycan-binding domain-containing protein [Sulfuricella sp.]|nr:LysM peptidoglycan-binding domain-containing protein [Sulfuricella sp.]